MILSHLATFANFTLCLFLIPLRKSKRKSCGSHLRVCNVISRLLGKSVLQ